jgi:ABC-type glutathione transport system ATPase component
MREFKENGKTIFFVSHALPQIREFCTKAMWIEYGVLKLYGEINEVADQYQKFLNEYNKMTKEQRLEYRRAAVENQNHLLLNSTENSAKTYKIKLSGKIIKYVSVKKKNHIKKIPYNFDWHMLIFSVFTAIVREDIKALFICIGIITGALLIFQNSLIGYFSLMLIFSLVSGRMYVKDLLYARGYIPVKNVKKRNEEDIEDINTGDNNIEDQKRQD